MKTLITAAFIILILISTTRSKTFQSVTLVNEGQTPYQIVVSSEATPIEKKAASEFQKYIHKISEVTIPIVNDQSPVKDTEISIGNTRRLKASNVSINLEKLENDGFTIQTDHKRLIIAGGKQKGTLYGVYTFLEDYLGCRKYSASESYIPRKKNIRIGSIKRTDIPFIKHRELHMPDVFDDDYADWHKLDNRNERNRKWGMWVHTFDDLVPPEKYFKDHPEYFSQHSGKRISDAQLCLTNPDVFRLVVEGLQERMKKNPGAHYWSVSQNDTFSPCQCERCSALNRKYGGDSGSLLHFVNRVAHRFPSKVISTLAYQYSRAAPVNILPAENVNIMLCTIELNRSRPIETDPSSASFKKDIIDWGKLTDNIILWDYVVQFKNYYDPFPNLRVLQPNIQFFVRNNVRMMFQQGSSTIRSEFHRLRTYIIAKLLWNPDADVNAIKEDFINGYYGQAAPFITQYIESMHDALEQSGGNLAIYGYPWDGVKTYLTPQLLDQYEELFIKAEKAAANQPVKLARVHFARLPLDFAILEISRRNITPKLSIFKKIDERWQINPGMEKRLQRFVTRARKANVTFLNERDTTPDEYNTRMKNFFENGRQEHKAIYKLVKLLTTPSEKYPVGGSAALTDGLKGIDDYHFNWLGFEGTEMEAVIDMGKAIPITTISMDFLQDHNSWIWIPRKVHYFISRDGKSFKTVDTVTANTDQKQAGSIIETFCSRFPGRKARYIKVKTESLQKCPQWHKGAAGPAWIFTDEIIVR
jgi:hypothetical protein